MIAFALHGGAGAKKGRDYSVEIANMREIAEAARDSLKAGATALDVVTEVVRKLEDSGLYVAGKGASPNQAGNYELDASLMSGADQTCGSVTAIQGFANPVLVARAVMEKTPHVMLAGDGAALFAHEQGFAPIADEAEYFTRAGINAEYIRTIRNPVEPFLQAPPSPAANKPFFFIGRLEPEKGFEDAAKAARLANVPLHVIGDGAGRAVLERDYPEVVLHGWKNKDEIAALVTAARCIVISSRVPEPFGLAAVEAVASGIPVIIPQAALLAREIAELGCGLPFENGNIAALAAAMTRLAGDDEMVRAMSENCLRQRSSMAHTSLSWAEALFELYDEILERAHPGQQAALAG